MAQGRAPASRHPTGSEAPGPTPDDHKVSEAEAGPGGHEPQMETSASHVCPCSAAWSRTQTLSYPRRSECEAPGDAAGGKRQAGQGARDWAGRRAGNGGREEKIFGSLEALGWRLPGPGP